MNIAVTCGDLHTSLGFLYVVFPAVFNNHTLNVDCEQSWYLEDGVMIADPSDPQTVIDPVISVSSDRLVTSDCVNLKHEIRCDSAGSHFRHEIMFRVRNETAVNPNSDQLWWLLVLFIIIVLAFLCFLLRKRIFSCFQKEAPSICQRDEERVPESGAQMKLRSDESVSLNQNLNLNLSTSKTLCQEDDLHPEEHESNSGSLGRGSFASF